MLIAHPKQKESASTFVLKTYVTEEARIFYHSEVDAFRIMRPNHNIIHFYGSYLYRDNFNILLEYADKGDLEHYFREVQQPTTREDIVRFWSNFFMLGQALACIHEVPPSTDGPQIFQG
jgi:serine/threonine protein kinase